MSVMFIGRYNGQYWNFDGIKTMGSFPRVAADEPSCFPTIHAVREDAEALFPYEDPLPQMGVPFEFVRSFYLPEFNAELKAKIPGNSNLERARRAYGWVAIVKDTDFQQMIDTLKYPNGPLCQMYDIEIILLNNDQSTADVYFHMTPATWGSGVTLASAEPNPCYKLGEIWQPPQGAGSQSEATKIYTSA